MNVLKADTFEKVRLKNDYLFADIVNAIIFGGHPVISPSRLHDCDSNESTYLHLFGIDRTRDIIKKYHHESYMVMIGVENQSSIDETMPFRVMGYDFINYINQNKNYDMNKKMILKHNKENPDDKKNLPIFKLYPVTTIVLNYGEVRWDKARSLKEMMHVIPENLQEYINDWKINVMNIRDMDSIKTMNINYETALDLFAVTRSTKMLEIVERMKKEDFDMCTSIDKYEEKLKMIGYEIGYENGYINGYAEGLCEGVNELRKTAITNMLDLGMSVEEIIKLTNLSKEEIVLYLYH